MSFEDIVGTYFNKGVSSLIDLELDYQKITHRVWMYFMVSLLISQEKKKLKKIKQIMNSCYETNEKHKTNNKFL